MPPSSASRAGRLGWRELRASLSAFGWVIGKPRKYRPTFTSCMLLSYQTRNQTKPLRKLFWTWSCVISKVPFCRGTRVTARKVLKPGNASYYFSQTRLASQGTLQMGEQTFKVQGTSWMDHEFSTSALSTGQVGWDWFSIQLKDGSELMVFQIRGEDGSIDPFSSGTWIAPDGSTRHLEKGDFEILVKDTWKSPTSGVVYPSRWTVRVPELDLELELRPVIADQELDLTYQYWEGAVDITGRKAGEQVAGVGYVELTGYGRSMAGEF